MTIYRLTVLLEEKVDLEAIHDINEEMQENARQVDLLHLYSFPCQYYGIRILPPMSFRVRFRSEPGQVKNWI